MHSTGADSAKPAARHYDLFVTEGAPRRFFWRLRDEGISLTAGGLEWHIDGEPRARAWGEIEAVHLVSSHIPRSGDIYQCTIRFRGGPPIVVRSTTAYGLPDETRDGDYFEFVQALHGRLADPEFSRVRFEAGLMAGRVMFLKIVLAFAALLFVGLPLVLLFMVPSWEALGILGVGAAFMWPLWRMAQANEPRTYSARDLPYDLLP